MENHHQCNGASEGVETRTDHHQSNSIKPAPERVETQTDTATIRVAVKQHFPCKNEVESILRDNEVVLFVGEGFTFAVALAAALGGWRGIVSTTKRDSLPEFVTVQDECKKYCRINGEKLEIKVETVNNNIKEIGSVTANNHKWLCGVDPTRTEKLILKGKVAWYQCPWISRKEDAEATGSHILDFLNHMAAKQDSDDYVLIGITKHDKYALSYNLGDLLEFREKIASGKCKCQEYNFIGADNSFIRKILEFGYHHEGLKDIHPIIFHDHITLIFRRKQVTNTAKST